MTYRAVTLLLVCAPTLMTCDCPLLVTGRSTSQMYMYVSFKVVNASCLIQDVLRCSSKKAKQQERSRLVFTTKTFFYFTASGHFISYTCTMESTVISHEVYCMISSDDTATEVLNEICNLELLLL